MRSDAIWGQLCEIVPSRNIRWPAWIPSGKDGPILLSLTEFSHNRPFLLHSLPWKCYPISDFLLHPIRRPDTTKQEHLCLAGYLKRLLQDAERGKIKLKLKVFNDVEDLLHRVSNILKKITPLVMENDPLFYPLLNSQWTYYKPYMYKEQDYDEGQKDEADEERFSQCVREITGSRISNSDLCTISDDCWEAMMTKGAPTSVLYYQVMFFILGEASGKVEFCSVWLIKPSIWIYVTRRSRWLLRISSDRDDRMGAKIKTPKKSLGFQTKPKKIPWPKLTPKKFHAKYPVIKSSRKH